MNHGQGQGQDNNEIRQDLNDRNPNDPEQNMNVDNPPHGVQNDQPQEDREVRQIFLHNDDNANDQVHINHFDIDRVDRPTEVVDLYPCYLLCQRHLMGHISGITILVLLRDLEPNVHNYGMLLRRLLHGIEHWLRNERDLRQIGNIIQLQEAPDLTRFLRNGDWDRNEPGDGLEAERRDGPAGGNGNESSEAGDRDEPPGDGNGDEPSGNGNGDESPGAGSRDEPPGDGNVNESSGGGNGNESSGAGNRDETSGDGNGDEPSGDEPSGDEPSGDGNGNESSGGGNGNESSRAGNRDETSGDGNGDEPSGGGNGDESSRAGNGDELSGAGSGAAHGQEEGNDKKRKRSNDDMFKKKQDRNESILIPSLNVLCCHYNPPARELGDDLDFSYSQPTLRTSRGRRR